MTDPPTRVAGPAVARALSHPTRHRLLNALGQNGATISQLAHQLALNKGSVSHHLGVLVDAGLVKRGRTRTVRGGTERYFESVARKITFDVGREGEAAEALLTAMIPDLVADPDHLLHHRTVRLAPRQAQALSTHLDTVVDGLEPASGRAAEYGVLVSVYRRRSAR
jgi:DNA-binding transcriptional ArsR family regulator